MGEKEINLWEAIGNKCLAAANTLLDKETTPTAATAKAVETLVNVALSIDGLNDRWGARNPRLPSAVRAAPGLSSARP